MGKGKRAMTRIEKAEMKEQQENQHIGRTIIGVIIIICIACFIILTLRKFYILNTYAIAMGQYSKKDNYSLIMYNNQGMVNTSYYKDGKSVFILKPTQNRQMYRYTDGKESILKIDSDGDKVAIISEGDVVLTGPSIISAFGEGMTSWQNFLLSFITQITEEECNGKACYKVSLNGMLVWIDKETYLTVRTTNGYMVNSDGTKTPVVNNYLYEFGTVTDEQVARPDLTGYKIQE